MSKPQSRHYFDTTDNPKIPTPDILIKIKKLKTRVVEIKEQKTENKKLEQFFLEKNKSEIERNDAKVTKTLCNRNVSFG